SRQRRKRHGGFGYSVRMCNSGSAHAARQSGRLIRFRHVLGRKDQRGGKGGRGEVALPRNGGKERHNRVINETICSGQSVRRVLKNGCPSETPNANAIARNWAAIEARGGCATTMDL